MHLTYGNVFKHFYHVTTYPPLGHPLARSLPGFLLLTRNTLSHANIMPTHDRVVVALGCCVYATRYVMTLLVVGNATCCADATGVGGVGVQGQSHPLYCYG